MAEEDSRERVPPIETAGGSQERCKMLCTADLTSGLDIPAILDRVGGDVDLLREIAAIFLDEYPVLLRDIRTAVANRNSSLLEHAAHSLKGSVANFGCPLVTDAAFVLEQLGRNKRIDEAAPALATLEARLEAFAPSLHRVVEGNL